MFSVNEDYEKLEVYQLGYDAVLRVYYLTDNFPEAERTVLGSQLRRAALSVPLNIAEGSGAGTYRSYLNFLLFAYRSLRELQVGLRLAHDLKFLRDVDFSALAELCDKCARKLWCYMKYVDERGGQSRVWKRHQKTEEHWAVIAKPQSL